MHRRCAQFASRFVTVTTLLACCVSSPAAAQVPDLTQYAHTSWRAEALMAKAFIRSFAQTPDGYLWCGTSRGLFRFDGVRFTEWQPPNGQQLPSPYILALTVTSDGTLWIGTRKGLASWRDGTLTHYEGVTGAVGSNVLERADGTRWFTIPRKMCAIRGQTVSCDNLDDDVAYLIEDRADSHWVVTSSAILRWGPGAPHRYPFPPGLAVHGAVALDESALLVVGNDDRLWKVTGETIEPFPVRGLGHTFTPSEETPEEFRIMGIMKTRDRALWLSSDQGLLHVHDGRVDRFSVADGLSGDGILAAFEDRESNVWVSTTEGMDRFRPVAIRTMSSRQGLSSSTVWAVQATPAGDVWISTAAGLNRVTAGSTSVVGTSLRGPVYALGLDAQGQLLASTPAGLVTERDGRFPLLRGSVERPVFAIATDAKEKIWMSTTHGELLARESAAAVEHVRIDAPRATLDRGTNHIRAILSDPDGGVWLGFKLWGLAYLNARRATTVYVHPEKRVFGDTTHIRLGSDGWTWASSGSGVARMKDGRITFLSTRTGLPCTGAAWTMEDDDRTLWIGQPCGLVRIDRSEWEAWVKDPKRVVQTTLLGGDDGVRPLGYGRGLSPLATRSTDGRIWFVVTDGVSVLNPRERAPELPPLQPQIEQFSADGRIEQLTTMPRGGIHLGPLLRDLEFTFTAPAFTTPEKVRFRFRLDGQDRDWREVVNQRRVTYSNLSPGPYRFQVMAANAGGVWSRDAAVLTFDVAPAFYQRRSFIAAMALLGVVLVGLTYRLRVRQVSRQLSRRFDERLAERTRVARELHDTFLQTVQGSRIVADHAIEHSADHAGMARAMGQLSEWLRQAAEEARAAVNSLRASTADTNDLAAAFRGAVDECRVTSRADMSLTVEGDVQEMHPVVRDEIFRIGAEAIRNACAHSGGDRVVISLAYARDFTLRVSDNGGGIDPAILDGGKNAHFGLRGMQERAEHIGARFTIDSSTPAGTAVTLVVPGRVAYGGVHVAKT